MAIFGLIDLLIGTVHTNAKDPHQYSIAAWDVGHIWHRNIFKMH